MEKNKEANHYIDNVKFSEELVKYHQQVTHAKENNLPIPSINDYIGDCFIKIARGRSREQNFNQYVFIEEMISDAIENCLKVVTNYDPTKSIWVYNQETLKTKFIRPDEYEEHINTGWLNGKYNKKTGKVDQVASNGINPFAYFSQICYFAFVRRIKAEKKELHIKYRWIDQFDLIDIISQSHDEGEFKSEFLEILRENNYHYEYERTSSISTKTKKSKPGIDLPNIFI